MNWRTLRSSALALSLVFIASSLCRAEQKSARSPSGPLRVMTFNIRYNEPSDGPNAWPHRRKNVASMIRFHKADVVGLQEALVGQIHDLEKELPRFAWVGVGRSDGAEKGEYGAIFYRPDQLELLRHATFWYSDSLDLKSKSWDGLPRIVTWAELRQRKNETKVEGSKQGKANNDTFFVFNTHLGFSAEHRKKSIPLLRKQIAKIAGDSPVVLMGDFNMRTDSAQYANLVKPFENESQTLRDAFSITEAPHHGPTGTYNGFGKEIASGKRIDYIFVNGKVRVLAHAILSDKFDGRFPSDHAPVLAEIKLP